jgi:hypothetical protein
LWIIDPPLFEDGAVSKEKFFDKDNLSLLLTKIAGVDTSDSRTIIIFTADDTSSIAFECARNAGYFCQYKYWLRTNITDHKGISFAPSVVPLLYCTIAKHFDYPSSYFAQNMVIWPKQTIFKRLEDKKEVKEKES